MKTLGNILWVIFGGLIMALLWCIVGLIMCVIIIGIPLGIQAFKMAGLAISPFKKEVVYSQKGSNVFLNIIWILLGGVWLALAHYMIGILYFITIIGIPFGKQHLKIGKLALMPFGAQVVKVERIESEQN